MKKIVTFLMILLLNMACVLPVFATEANVIYDGNAKAFIFEPGTDCSLTDLFPNFKDVMPGDSIFQQITVKNTAPRGTKVKIYMRALGAWEESEWFLSQLGLRVELADNTVREPLFDAAASETDGLANWVCLGTFDSGSEVDLNVILDVPVELDNWYSSRVGFLDWEFKVEEIKGGSVSTGDNGLGLLWSTVLFITGTAGWFLLLWRRKERNAIDA